MRRTQICAALFVFAAAWCGIGQEKEMAWQVTAQKFETIDVPSLYEPYATELPAMLNSFCAVPASRLVTVQEKKMRILVDDAAKKLSLIRERSALVTERDSLYLAVMTERQKKKKNAAFAKKIKEKETEIKSVQARMEKLLVDTSFAAETKPFAVWNSGEKVLELPQYANIPQSLKKEGISAVITGSIQDIAGYMYVSVVLTTGLPGMSEYRFNEAGPYQSIETVARSLAAQVMTAIRNTTPARVKLALEPRDAKLYIDNEYIKVSGSVILLYEGRHRLEALASGYDSAGKTIETQAGKSYELTIRLKKTETVPVAFPSVEPAADVFAHTQYLAGTPFQTDIPTKKRTVLTFAYGDVRSYIVLHPPHFIQNGKAPYQLSVALNKENMETIINRRRSILYWSLGAFYISLPIFMILKGITEDMAFALSDYRIANNESAQNKYDTLFSSTMLMQGITIGLGINYAVQLGLYLRAANQSIPKEALR